MEYNSGTVRGVVHTKYTPFWHMQEGQVGGQVGDRGTVGSGGTGKGDRKGDRWVRQVVGTGGWDWWDGDAHNMHWPLGNVAYSTYTCTISLYVLYVCMYIQETEILKNRWFMSSVLRWIQTHNDTLSAYDHVHTVHSGTHISTLQ